VVGLNITCALVFRGDKVKGLVVYDSFYTNTRQVAEAIAAQIISEGHQVDLVSAREGLPTDLDHDFALVGSPTRMGRMTRHTKRYVKKLAKVGWGNKPLATFDTVMPGVEENDRASAAQKLHDLAKGMGMSVRSPVLHTKVTGMRGPLAPDALEKAKAYASGFLASLSQ